MSDPVILWLRQDLRLRDQPALIAAAEAGPVIPVYVLDEEGPGDWRIGGAQLWWLHHSLASLAQALDDKGSRLILRRGAAADVLRAVMEETGAAAIHALRHYEPWWRDAEDALGEALVLHDGNHLTHLEALKTGSGQPFRIFSGFWKALQKLDDPEKPLPAPRKIDAPSRWPESESLDDWKLLPTEPDWASAFGEEWTPGEDGAQKRLKRVADLVRDYETDRNKPSIEGTSRLSPHLHHGEVSARAVWHAAAKNDRGAKFRQELAWRDFTSALLMKLPDYADKDGVPRYEKLKWRTGAAANKDLRAWQRGRTGYPLVDAGMRQLWQTGWLHNRARLVTGSFLAKHLLLDWREGERWYWDCLVCADYGNNSVNWQWVAGTGVDANQFSRILAPITQSERYEAADYIRRWVPELAHLSDEDIHDPDAAGCRPDDYPAKIVEHREARERALEAGRAVPKA